MAPVSTTKFGIFLFLKKNHTIYSNQSNHKSSGLSHHQLIIPVWIKYQNIYCKYCIVDSIASSVLQYESYHDQVYQYTPNTHTLIHAQHTPMFCVGLLCLYHHVFVDPCDQLTHIFRVASLALNKAYRKISNISGTKSLNLNVCHLDLHMSWRNILKPSVGWRMKM